MPEAHLPRGAVLLPVALTLDAVGRAVDLAAQPARPGTRGWASLEGPGDSLPAALDALDTAGVEAVGLLGISARAGAAPLSWLRRVAGHWRRDSGAGLDVLVWPAALPPGAEPPGTDAPGWRAVTGREAPLRSEAWEGLPGFRHHLLLCAGVRCKAQGADAVAAAVAEELTARGAHDDDVLVTRTLCQFPCNNAPVVSVYPDSVWLRRVSPSDARALIARLLDEQDPPGQPERLPRGATR